MLAVEQLSLGRGARLIVSGIDLQIDAGWALQIHGANGSGKTTLLRVLAGLLRPAAGRIHWRGVDVRTQPASLRRDLAFLGHANGVSDDLTVLENLRFAALLGAGTGNTGNTRSGVSQPSGMATNATTTDKPTERTEQTERDVLAHAGLLPLQHTRVGLLSQGQRRRVALARLALERKPLWLLDEPADALDGCAADWLDDCLCAHLKAGGVLVATTHRALHTPADCTRHLDLGRSGAWLD
ncbi:heme ABC exporter ATP-binding protein CcmA [Paraburkholderia sp. DHOC27]|uniref:heme ABC exporter ATP-binding protein CcmA n=1 Tax=Paraburkholderia sp. DHOC27 TaxID=2303330 RepID=UPI000E3D9FA7|nr:heme ABC exporter ATP-binding protein CcmA [Paraburkholderia sp. DHOC27]RFU49010.1 heme ABC exporter ATP-binding protein CcmA [Paraburkholderia sp. DHOC27]